MAITLYLLAMILMLTICKDTLRSFNKRAIFVVTLLSCVAWPLVVIAALLHVGYVLIVFAVGALLARFRAA